MTRRFGRPSFRDTMLASRRALEAMGPLPDDMRRIYESKLPPAPKRRAPRGASGKPLERDILRAVLQALRVHPKVAFVHRLQSGLLQDGDRMIRVGSVGMPDLCGMLKGGRAFYIECKRPGEKPNPSQQAWLNMVHAFGGASGCATSVEEALDVLLAPDA